MVDAYRYFLSELNAFIQWGVNKVIPLGNNSSSTKAKAPVVTSFQKDQWQLVMAPDIQCGGPSSPYPGLACAASRVE